MTARHVHRGGVDGVDEVPDVFTPEVEALLCELVLGTSRHGLEGVIVPM